LKTISFIDIAARHSEVAEDVERRVKAVLRSGRYVGGPVVAEAETLAAAWFGRTGAVGVASGTDALMLALQAVGVKPGDEVIVPALTFFATAGAVCAIGAIPVIVDVDERGCLDPQDAARARTEKTSAVVPVHLFGNRSRTPDLNVPVVDDAAQAIGADPPASTGILTAVSTYPTKTWGAAGEGGFVVGEGDLLQRVRSLGNHGATRTAHVHVAVAGAVGRNSRLDAIQAAVLLGHAPAVARRVARRRALAARYDAGLPVSIEAFPRDEGSPVQQYVVHVENRPEVQSALSAAGVPWQVYYPRPLGDQPALEHAIRHPTPRAARFCETALALPIHAGLSDADVDRVLEVLS